jgi:ABC-type proline/glycine betaine transport system ATPase subunit
LWWEQSNWNDLVNNKDAQFKPFVLKTVERSGYSCSQCNWMQMCSGCILTPTNDFIDDFFKKCHIAIEWHSSLIEEEYNQSSNEVLQHSSTSIKDNVQEDNINLEDCLRKFHEVEDMGSNDNIFCT